MGVEDLDFDLDVSEDGKTITLVIRGRRPITYHQYVLELEQYLHDISKALDQKTQQGVMEH